MPEKQRQPSVKSMKKRNLEHDADEMVPEYHFSEKNGVRGKYYEAYRQGHAVRIHNSDGSLDVKYFTLDDGAVLLEPDVRKHFQDSRSVNRALRKLILDKQSRRRAN